MTPQFLRSEAARFREMAESVEREASRQRLLGMAADYEARAQVAEASQPAVPVIAPEPEPDPAAEDAVTESEEPSAPRKTRTRLRLTRSRPAC